MELDKSSVEKVSIVIANLNGKHHLRECLNSIKKLRYPEEKIEVIIVDNGSTDGSAEFIQENYPWVRLIRNKRNEGFAKPSNDGAKAATGKYVAFLNNDMKVKSDWLSELIASLRENKAQCAGSVILNWDGKLLDFAGGGVNFMGLGYQDNFRRPMTEMEPILTGDREILFACGGAMLIEREVFLSAGGFDEDYFAYYEDTDLGWRLNVLGYKVVLSVKSRVFHKHNSTSKTVAQQRIQYLFERNKLYTCYKNYCGQYLNKIFLPSLLLQMRGAYLESGIDGFNYDIKNPGAFDAEPVSITHSAAIKLSAINEFAANIAKMTEKRTFIQKNRKTADVKIAKLVDKPFIVFPQDSGKYLSSEYDIIKAFGMDRLLGGKINRKVLLITGDGEKTESETAHKRCTGIFKALERVDGVSVTAACPTGCEPVFGRGASYSRDDISAVTDAVKKSTVVLIMGAYPESIPMLKKEIAAKYIAVDIPSVCGGCMDAESVLRAVTDYAGIADFFIFSDDRQRNFAQGVLSAAKPLNARDAATEVPRITSVVDLPDSGNPSLSSLEDFIKNPCRTMFKAARADEPELQACAPAAEESGRHVSMRKQLEMIERNQNVIKGMLQRDGRLIKETYRSGSEIKKWIALMENRLAVFKAKLSRIRILRKFFS